MDVDEIWEKLRDKYNSEISAVTTSLGPIGYDTVKYRVKREIEDSNATYKDAETILKKRTGKLSFVVCNKLRNFIYIGIYCNWFFQHIHN